MSNFLTYAILLFTFAIISVKPAESGLPEKASVSITISSTRTDIKLGSPLPIEITLLNTSDHAIVVEQDISRKAEFVYTINVFEASGRETPKTDYYGVHRGQPPKKPMIVEGSSIQVTVQAGKIIKDYADLNELYDISQPGKYTIQVERTDPTTRSVVKSNSIVVTVTS